MNSTDEYRDRIEQIIIDYFFDNADSQQLTELANWISLSPENRDYFTRAQELHFATLNLSQSKKNDTESAYREFLNRIEQHKEHQRKATISSVVRWVAATAAVVIVMVGLSVFFYSAGEKSIEEQFAEMVIEAPIGSSLKFVLPDGTTAFLNSGSTARYSQGFGVVNRDIELTGEGYFEVTKDENLPFQVLTNELTVRVLGTKFDIANYPNRNIVTVSLIEGAVTLNKSNGDELCRLKPEQQAEFNKATERTTIRNVKSHNSRMWTEGEIYFNEESLDKIVEVLKQNYAVEIVVTDKSLNDLRFYGSFLRHDMTIDQILSALSSTGKIKYERKDNIIYIKPNNN